MMQHHEAQRIRVLQSVREIKPTTNPYLVMLITHLREHEDVDVSLFSFPRAFFHRYDVFHVHWPEVTFGGHNARGRLMRRSLTSLLLLRLTLTRTPIVRTWHNTDRPTGLSRWDHVLLDGFDRLTRVRIRLNGLSRLSEDVPVITIPLGHYREWFAGRVTYPARRGRVAYVGLIRRYKGVEDLVRRFRDVTHPAATLHICGKPSSEELVEEITALAEGDDRIHTTFGFVEEDDFVREVTEASLVALPFLHMHNSSTVLTALSLDRPVLVPDGDVNRAMAEEVGPGWIHMYSGELTSAVIDETLRRIDERQPPAPPNLDARGWDEAADLHLDAYRLARSPRT
ncbi:glycosyltransferase [Tessaracoccus sp.]